MAHERRIWVGFTLLITAALLLTGCATPQPTFPTAVLYDRDRDEFSVEVRPVPEGEEPMYPEELGFVTLIDGKRHEGLLPTPTAYVVGPSGVADQWLGPYWVEFKDSKWRLQRVRMALPYKDKPDQNQPLVVQCRIKEYRNYVPRYPVYLIQIKGSFKFLTL